MKAVVFNRYGGNEEIEISEVPAPSPRDSEVLIEARAASVNPVDWKIRNGLMKILTGRRFPKVLGMECAGEVVRAGSRVTRFKGGDRVVCFTGIRRLSAFAELVCAPEKTTFPMPEKASFEDASALPIAGLTALQALRNIGRITPGASVLVNGASGGVGTFAVQIAKIHGALVTGVCSASNAGLVKELGADRVIDYAQEDFTKGGSRYDIILDAVSARSFSDCKGALAPKGVYVNTLPSLPVALHQYVIGFLSRRKAGTVSVSPNALDMGWMKEQFEAGRLRTVIDRTYPLASAKDALAYSETGRARGKIILII